ncbi:GOLPH3/VPS74 family protein [Actinacidiphila sp. ITFR-21]|uniref:GOLPH3/VPS74 family protein n=1 Tax=Actinacidiphila sp. ITFR-21 TaxID=3075199 RepID=UPI00288C4D5C|nr:GPP34 family phosphoprotein [Streptomyces sp. ITFR-21]WNI17116.1 GPP34 family phosphoprotein [Streptomyces sp. ITFR-21]
MTTTPRDLLIVAMDMPSTRPVERGDLSLALAGAELIDLLRAGAVRLLRSRLVPEPSGFTVDDPLLGAAAAALADGEPREPVTDWLWRRGRGLAATYLAAFEAEGQLTRQRSRRWGVFRSSRKVLVDSPARTRAANRWAADEPVLAALAAAVGIRDRRAGDYPDVDDDAASAVLAAVTTAVGELDDERGRRARKLDDAAVTNYRRGY